MKLHKSLSFLLISALIHQATCDEKLTKQVKKNSKTIKTLKNENKKLMSENKSLRGRLEKLETFVNSQQNDFITGIDAKVDQLFAFWDFDIGSVLSSELAGNSGNTLLLSIKNWLTKHSNSFSEFSSWRNNVDNDISRLDQKQDDFLGNLGGTNGNIQNLQTLTDDFNMELLDLKNKYVFLQNRMEFENESMNDKVAEVVDKVDGFEEAFTTCTSFICSNATSLETENPEPGEITEDLNSIPIDPLSPVSNATTLEESVDLSCSNKYIEAFNNISYINSEVEVELAYNSMDIANGINIKRTNAIPSWTSVIIPMKSITGYKVDNDPKKSKRIMVGWTQHSTTNIGFNFPGDGSPIFDKSIALYSDNGAFYGKSAIHTDMTWYKHEANEKFEFNYGKSITCKIEDGEWTFEVGSETGSFNVSSHFSKPDEMFPAISMLYQRSIKISDIQFGDLQC